MRFAAIAWLIVSLHSIAPPLCALPQLAGPETAPGEAGQGFRVLTWNIQGCARGVDPVLLELQQHNPDIICLQEAEVGTEHTNGADQAAVIAKRLHLYQCSAGSAFAKANGEQHMAILARRQLENIEPLDAGTGRIYGVTAITRLQGRPTRVVCIHLTNSYWRGLQHALTSANPSTREAADLARRLKGWAGPVVLAGDFNAVPGAREHDLLARQLQRVPTTQPTYPADQPRLAVDHVYHSTDLQPTRFTSPQTKASDHRPVIAELRLAFPPTTAPTRNN